MVKTVAACFHRVAFSSAAFYVTAALLKTLNEIKNTKQAGSALHVYYLVRVCVILWSCTVIIVLFFDDQFPF